MSLDVVAVQLAGVLAGALIESFGDYQRQRNDQNRRGIGLGTVGLVAAAAIGAVAVAEVVTDKEIIKPAGKFIKKKVKKSAKALEKLLELPKLKDDEHGHVEDVDEDELQLLKEEEGLKKLKDKMNNEQEENGDIWTKEKKIEFKIKEMEMKMKELELMEKRLAWERKIWLKERDHYFD